MSFSWITSGVGYTRRVSEISELQTNVNHLYDKLSLPHFSWVLVPPAVGTISQPNVIQEVRNALDYVYDHNVCTAEHSTYLTNEHTSYNPSVCASNYAGYCYRVWNGANGPY